MFNSSDILPFYVVFQPMASSNPMLPAHSFLPETNLMFWTLPLPSTNCVLQSQWPQNIQNISLNLPPFGHHLPSPAVGPNEDQMKPLRKAKSKRVRNSQKELESAKKNSESNILNQLFSFFNSYEKSQGVVERAIRLLGKDEAQLQKIKYIFYNIVRLINYRRGRKYVNKTNILHYYRPEHFMTHIPDILQKLAEINLITLEQLCLLFRVTTNYFIRNISFNAILTSKRISLLAKTQHLARRRKVLHSLYHHHQ